jgi:Na+/H+-dicarboxylate symporter
MYLISIAAVLAMSLLAVSIREKVSPLLILRKNLPAALIGLTTASSSAAYSQNTRTCRNELGISKSVTSIGVSLGQTIFKPGVCLDFFLLGVFCAEFYNVPLSLDKLISYTLFCYILSIAAPPVPGGGLTCFALLSAQLGLPEEAVALMCTLGIIPDFLVTSLNMCVLQQALILIDGSLGSLDRSLLKTGKQRQP